MHPTPAQIPVPDGFFVRPAVRDDLDEIVALIRAAETAVCGTTTANPGEVSSDWHDPRFDMTRDTRVVTDGGGRLVAYALAWGVDPALPVDLYYELHPDFADAGLDDYLVGLLLARAREHAGARDPAAGQAGIALWCLRDDERKRALYERLGAVRTRVFLRMTIDTGDLPPAHPWPAGTTVAPFRRDEDERKVHAAINDAFSEHFHASAPPLDTWRAQVLGDDDFDPELFFIARDGDEVAGAVLCFTTPEVGIVDQLAVRKPWRGRGLGKALLLHALHQMSARGHERFQLGVDAQNATGATQLYLGIGMRPTRVTDFYERPLAGVP
jgi:mycothiol synthase